MRRRFRPPICVPRSASANVHSRNAVSNSTPGSSADVAQLVAHHLAKVRVAGSNPVIRSEGSRSQESSPGSIPFRWSGRVVRQRPAKPSTRVRFPSPPPRRSDPVGESRAISSAGERFPDTEEVTGSIPVSRTTTRRPGLPPGRRAFPGRGALSGAWSFVRGVERSPGRRAWASAMSAAVESSRARAACLGRSHCGDFATFPRRARPGCARGPA